FSYYMLPRLPISTLFPYTRSSDLIDNVLQFHVVHSRAHIDAVAGMISDLLRRDAAQRMVKQLDTGARPSAALGEVDLRMHRPVADRKSTRLNSSHGSISYAVFCVK